MSIELGGLLALYERLEFDIVEVNLGEICEVRGVRANGSIVRAKSRTLTGTVTMTQRGDDDGSGNWRKKMLRLPDYIIKLRLLGDSIKWLFDLFSGLYLRVAKPL